MQNSFSSVSGLKFNPSQASEVNVNPFSLSPTTTIQKSIIRRKGFCLFFFPFLLPVIPAEYHGKFGAGLYPILLAFSLSLSLVSLYSGLLCTLSSSRAFSLRFRGRVRGSELGGHTVYVCVCVCEERERESVCVCVCV